MTDKERLEKVKEVANDIKELCNKHDHRQADIAKCYFFEKHGKWLIEQAKRVEQSKNQLYECPVCGFEYHKRHEDVNGGYTCPTCSEADLVEQNKRYRELLERAFKAKDLADIWDIEDEYEALEESK